MLTERPQRIQLRAEEQCQAATLRSERVRVLRDSALPEYRGETTVTPSAEPQTLPTADTVMRQDVTVRQIPYFLTTNASGGYTAIIGG